jgi:tetratricopeptide (TPR) repeat protein
MSANTRWHFEDDLLARQDSAATLRFLLLAGLLGLSGIASGERDLATTSAKSPMQQHYSAAFQYQNAGNLSRAASEYELFLSIALHRIANGRANLGEYARAAPLYEEALRLQPDDHSLQMDYAGAALDASDWRRAKNLATSVLDLLETKANSTDPRAVSIFARALLELGEHQEALEQFKAAAQLRPGYESSSELAVAYLVLGDRTNAAKIFSGMPERFGDTAALHLKMGILYGKTKFFDDAIEEFKIAIAKDSQLSDSHYSLGASYMVQSGEPGYDNAEVEFRKEIAIDPNNSLVYAPLGRIAMSRHRYAEAESDLKRAIDLNPMSTGTYITLGQLYRETRKVAEAKAAYRKAIALTLDPSKNGYEVEQAHFWLGRLLVESGNTAEARKELDVSRDLLYQRERQVESRLAGNTILQAPLEKTHEPKPGDLAAQTAFEKQVTPLIASSYDNLGVDAARAGDYTNASAHFGHAAQWNPTLRGLDKNWGYAAFEAKEYSQVAEPLSRMLVQHPEDVEVRSMLGLSYSMVHDYARALQVLRPIEVTLNSNPQLELAYLVSMAIAGDYDQGIAQLKALEEAHSEVAIIHCFIGEAYESKGHYEQAAGELNTALHLDPTSADARFALALADVALGEKQEALTLFSELAKSGSREGAVYYQLGKLQAEFGSAKAAVGNLETAVGLWPSNADYHRELAEAYRKNKQSENADREDKESEALQAGAAPANKYEHRAISNETPAVNTPATKRD